MDFFNSPFDTSGFSPRWYCGLWSAEQGWLHILSDLGVWSAYLAIPCVLGFFILRKKDVPFRGIFWLFVAFILACGTTHLMEAIIFWWPAYRLAGLIKLFTAIVSWTTVIALVPVVPQALAMRSPRELEREIAERKRAGDALRESEERFRGTFENAAVGIAHKDTQGRFLRVNQRYCEIVGYTREELLERTFHDIAHPEDLADEHELYTRLMRGESSSYSRERRYLRKDRSIGWTDASLSLQRDTAGRPAYTIAIIQDISGRKRLEAELRHAKEVAESANRAKDEFLANVSHEIRTPFGAILGMTELVLDTQLTEDQRQCLETVKSAADSLLGVINDLLDFSKIEAGKLELDAGDFSLRAALGDTLRALAVRAHRKRLELVCHVRPDVPEALVGDAGRLRQVLVNLVGNAIKFTEHGEVVVEVETEAPPAKTQRRKEDEGWEGEAPAEPGAGSAGASPSLGSAGASPSLGSAGASPSPGSAGASSSRSSFAPLQEVLLRLSVRDTGIGIPPDKQEAIFCAFEQEDTSTTRKYGGTGLGLTIAVRLVTLMGGTITVDSQPGRGSTFAFTARFRRQLHPQEHPAVRPNILLNNLQVLIVDDNATNCHILLEWLRSWQMSPTAVSDGLAAMDVLWHGAASGQPYALVLLDLCMPDIDGLALAARIRQRGELTATRIILLTSGERPGDLARSRELRIDAHLLKPVPQEELLETIYRVMSRTDGPVPAHHPAPQPGPDGVVLRILVAEDNEFNTRHLERLLSRHGHSVRLAGNGREAIELLGIASRESGVRSQESEEGGDSLRTDQQPLTADFDLLLLDLHMPEMDGFEVVDAIREWESAHSGHLPIIALTARSRKEDREHCLTAGMDEYLSKPVRAAELFAVIDRVAPAHRIVQAAQPAAPDHANLLDPAVLLAACGDDAEGLRELCQDLQTYAPARLAALADAFRDQNPLRLRETAHKLCGLLSAFSTVAGTLAANLEDQAERSQLEEARPLMETLETMTRELLRQVDGISLASLQHQAVPDGDANAGADT